MIFITDVLPGEIEILLPSVIFNKLLIVDLFDRTDVLFEYSPQLMAGHTKNCVPSIFRLRDYKELMPTSEIPGSAQQRYRKR